MVAQRNAFAMTPLRRDLVDVLHHEHAHASVARAFGARRVKIVVYRHRHRRPGQVYWHGWFDADYIRSDRGLRCVGLAGAVGELLLGAPRISPSLATQVLREHLDLLSRGDARLSRGFSEADVRDTLRLLRRYRGRLRRAVAADEARLLPRRRPARRTPVSCRN